MKGSKNIHSARRIRVLLTILILVLVWAGYTSYQQWQSIVDKKEKYTAVQDDYNKQIMLKKELEKKVVLLQNDDYIADLARKFYFFSKPEEVIFITPNN